MWQYGTYSINDSLCLQVAEFKFVFVAVIKGCNSDLRLSNSAYITQHTIHKIPKALPALPSLLANAPRMMTTVHSIGVCLTISSSL